jgi:UDP-glucose 4-epimerase
MKVSADVRDGSKIRDVFDQFNPQVVAHLAGLKSVPESVISPLDYYDVNVNGLIQVCRAARSSDVDALLFSSSATVYASNSSPMSESAELAPASPYGRTKLICEQLLLDFQSVRQEVGLAIFRYFNPAGAHASGEIGEDPTGPPGNLLPAVARVATGRASRVIVYGDNFPTDDGTGIRDYVHVQDLVDGHIAGLESCRRTRRALVLNLGTGMGASVLQVLATFENVTGVEIRREIGPRRRGDVPTAVADPTRAEDVLDWKARRSLDDICRDLWRWQSKNPNGYRA